MTDDEAMIFENLDNEQERAAFLLQFEVTAEPLVIKGVSRYVQAFVDHVALPIEGYDDEDVIRRGRKWLEEKAAA